MATTEVKFEVEEVADLYEFFQVSPSATTDTIHRIYRFWAARFHPDNPKTGNEEQFLRVRAVYDLLRDPERRAQYDATRDCKPTALSSFPLSSAVDFLDKVEGEMNRRLALLAILYSQRRADTRHPEVTLRDLESMLGFPREYFDFATWYLVQKRYIQRADNADFTITVSGVDYLEEQRQKVPALNQLLSNGKFHCVGFPIERRVNRCDRRMGLPDMRDVKTERRGNKRNRRLDSNCLSD